jgi:superfamily II DNA/RNA helicase
MWTTTPSIIENERPVDRFALHYVPQTYWRVSHAFWFWAMGIGSGIFCLRQFFGISGGGKFKGAIYKPFEYEFSKEEKLELDKEENFQYQQQFNLYDFMRRLLVKRFESSFGAFEQSVKNFINTHQIVLQFIRKTDKYILDRSLLEKIYKLDADDIENHLEKYSEKIKNNEYPKNHKVYKLKDFKRKNDFINDIQSDIELFQQILDEMHALDLVAKDPKAQRLIEGVKTVLNAPPENLFEPKRKVIIFSEYADTVKHLDPLLNESFDQRVLVVAGNLPAGKIREIIKNFDATAKQQSDDYDILLTTDKISEGFNLNRAGMVINYDIPWNPVRVIQRVGRINRISKKVFDKLYIVNFFPTEKGSDLVHSREIAAQKMFMIHNTLGEDAKIFNIDEEPTPSGLYSKIQRHPDYLEGESPYTKISKEFEALKEKYPDIVASLNDFPSRIKVAKEDTENELFVVVKKQKLFVHHQLYDVNEEDKNHSIEDVEDVLDKIKADKNEPLLPLSNRFWEEYETIKNYSTNNKKNNKPLPENTLQTKAIIVLRSLLEVKDNPHITLLKPFIRMLLEDLLDYGTLSQYTLRRISNIDIKKNLAKGINELKALEEELGSDYLYKEKQRISQLSKEIIVAIENRKTD